MTVTVRWLEVARVGELSTDGRLIEAVHVPATVRAFRQPPGPEPLRPIGVCDLRQRGSSIEARLIVGPDEQASAALGGTLEHPLVSDYDAELELWTFRSGVVQSVVVGRPHCWAT